MADLLSMIETSATVLTDIPNVNYSPDPNDNHIIATAIAAAVALIISGDKRHLLSLQEVEAISVITARQAVERFGLG